MEPIIVVVVVLGLLTVVVFAAIKIHECTERARMCEAMAKSFQRCPNNMVEGAQWLSQAWVVEMRKLGVDIEKP